VATCQEAPADEDPGRPGKAPVLSRCLTSSRSRRRIIGGIVRAPAAGHAADLHGTTTPRLVEMATPSSQASSGPAVPCQLRVSHKIGKLKDRKLDVILRMDVSKGTLSRGSGLGRQEARGAGLCRLPGGLEFCASAPALCLYGHEAEWGMPAGPGLAARHNLGRVQSAAALALDLGSDALRVPCFAMTASPTSSCMPTPDRPSSWGAVTKAKKNQDTPPKKERLLPELPTSPCSAGSIAWSVRLARAGARRGVAAGF